MMSEAYYYVPYDDPRVGIDWDENYHMLQGPDGFECLLTEPEDRKWYRDGRPVVERLNEQHKEIERLRADLGTCRYLLRYAVLRDGLCDEQWFEDAKKAGGDDGTPTDH